MITILTTNKYSKLKHNKEILNDFREHFITHNDTWIRGEEIETMVGHTGIRKYVNLLRCEGIPIVSNTQKGYKLTYSKKEIKRCYEELRNRALVAITACQKMKKML